jgi:hypothetical protein
MTTGPTNLERGSRSANGSGLEELEEVLEVVYILLRSGSSRRRHVGYSGLVPPRPFQPNELRFLLSRLGDERVRATDLGERLGEVLNAAFGVEDATFVIAMGARWAKTLCSRRPLLRRRDEAIDQILAREHSFSTSMSVCDAFLSDMESAFVRIVLPRDA